MRRENGVMAFAHSVPEIFNAVVESSEFASGMSRGHEIFIKWLPRFFFRRRLVYSTLQQQTLPFLGKRRLPFPTKQCYVGWYGLPEISFSNRRHELGARSIVRVRGAPEVKLSVWRGEGMV